MIINGSPRLQLIYSLSGKDALKLRNQQIVVAYLIPAEQNFSPYLLRERPANLQRNLI